MYTVLGKVEICQDVMPSPHGRRVGGVGGGWNANEGGIFKLLFCILCAFYFLDFD